MRNRTLLVVGAALVGFLLAIALQSRPADPESRLPRRYRLAALIERQQETTVALRRQVEDLRSQVDALVSQADTREAGVASVEARLAEANVIAGLVPVRGPGLTVTLDDSVLEKAPSGNVNDLVIHSQDVQAAVNAVWRAGAEAVSINGQRLVGTSAVLCVGNTLLLNGTVHSPPYVIRAVGANRERFEADRLVRRLRSDAEEFGVQVAVETVPSLQVPAYEGGTNLRFATPAA